mmetsp:Transcript_17243/g.39840  ORF Transcript_17243/g.39840 Transcript_17243/m.39840 type:complete len:103 (-) Transcript_17243:632-940(-)
MRCDAMKCNPMQCNPIQHHAKKFVVSHFFRVRSIPRPKRRPFLCSTKRSGPFLFSTPHEGRLVQQTNEGTNKPPLCVCFVFAEHQRGLSGGKMRSECTTIAL